MTNNKYTNLNVLSNNRISELQDMNNETAVNQVLAMINTSSNRAQKKELTKILRKVETIQSKCEKSAKDRADKELEIRADNDFMYIFAVVGLTLMEDYRWKEDPEQEHGQITSFYERLTKRIANYAEQGMSTKDIIDLLYEKSGVQLVSNNKK